MRCAAHPTCTVTCKNRFTPIPCLASCAINGCQCPAGTVLDEDANKCVPPSECPEGMINIYIAM